MKIKKKEKWKFVIIKERLIIKSSTSRITKESIYHVVTYFIANFSPHARWVLNARNEVKLQTLRYLKVRSVVSNEYA